VTKLLNTKQEEVEQESRPHFKFGNRPICKEYQEDEWGGLYGATPDCDGRIVSNFYGGGGVKCTKCRGWFCY
jgi:hypothetical protein